MRTIFDGIATTQIERALVLAAAAFIERDPAYSVAGRAPAARRAVPRSDAAVARPARRTSATRAYRDAFAHRASAAASAAASTTRACAGFDLAALAAALQPERDALFQYLGIQTLADRYLARDDGRTVELPQAFWMRVAMGLAVDEAGPHARARSSSTT